jgi:hypothetical protein
VVISSPSSCLWQEPRLNAAINRIENPMNKVVFLIFIAYIRDVSVFCCDGEFGA